MHLLKAVLVLLLFFTAETSRIRAQVPAVRCGTLVRLNDFPSRHVPPRHIDIWLPPGYSHAQRYPVLYMHDGNSLFDSAITWNHQAWDVDDAIGKLTGSGAIRPCIVVGIWNAGRERHSEYCPQKPFESFSMGLQDSLFREKRRDGSVIFSSYIRSDAYLRFIVNELKPRIDSTFSTLPDRRNTLIAGSSMGGIISLYAMCEYPEVFGVAACLSTHWTILYRNTHNPFPNAILAYFEDHLPDPATHRLYFDLGTETLDTLYAKHQSEMDQVLKRKGFNEKNSLVKTFPGADHSERSWGKRLEFPLTFLLNKTEE